MIIKQAFVHYRTALLRCGRTVLMSIFFQNLNYEIPIVEEIQIMPLNQKVFTQGKGWILFVFDHKPLVSWFPCVQYSMTLKQKIASFRKKTVGGEPPTNLEQIFIYRSDEMEPLQKKVADNCQSKLGKEKEKVNATFNFFLRFFNFLKIVIFLKTSGKKQEL